MSHRLLFLAPCLLCLGACASAPKAPFVASSLSRNNNQPHRALVRGGTLEGVVDRLITLAKQRELTLVRQSATGKVRYDLAFRSRPVDRRILRGTRSATLGYYSRYFVEVQRNADAVLITATGVPVLNGQMACPKYLEQRVPCDAPKLGHLEGSDIVSTTYHNWGYDVSGSQEAEILVGLLAELKRAKPGEAAAAAPATSAKKLIVAVFDIQDHTGGMDEKTLDQLTEYLAAQVTQRAGFKVVPRDQLRSRLAAEKVKSYRKCVDQRCQIELGKAMAAQKSLATKLLKVGKQ